MVTVQITYVQNLHPETNVPVGPTLWVCDEIGHAGRLHLQDVATPEVVARNLDRSYPGGFFAIRDELRNSGGLAEVFDYDPINRRVAVE